MTDEEFHLAVHNMSMSPDFAEAAFGRFLKEILPRYRQLAEAEATRVNFDPGDYAHSTLLGVSAIISVYAALFAKPGHERIARRLLIEGLQQIEREIDQ